MSILQRHSKIEQKSTKNATQQDKTNTSIWDTDTHPNRRKKVKITNWTNKLNTLRSSICEMIFVTISWSFKFFRVNKADANGQFEMNGQIREHQRIHPETPSHPTRPFIARIRSLGATVNVASDLIVKQNQRNGFNQEEFARTRLCTQ